MLTAMKRTSAKFNLITGSILISIILVIIIFTKINEPSIKGVYGIFRNKCCKDIEINQTYLNYANENYTYQVKNMKFGLTLMVFAEFSKRSAKKSEYPTTIIVNRKNGHNILVVYVDGESHDFVQFR